MLVPEPRALAGQRSDHQLDRVNQIDELLAGAL
jgi:hypothetical protein